MSTQRRVKQMISRGGIRTGAVTLAFMGLLVSACTPDQQATTPDTQTGAPAQTTTGATVDDDVQQYVGQTVTLRGSVNDRYGANAFRMTDSQLFDGDVLVVGQTGEPFDLAEIGDTNVQVTGEVRQFDATQVQQEFNLQIAQDQWQQFEGRPVIVAQSVALSPSPAEISDNPGRFYDRTVAVEGAVDEVWSPGAFRISGDQLFGGGDLLVLSETGQQIQVQDGQEVVLVGEIRQFVAQDIQQQYNLDWDTQTQQQLQADYQDQPVLIAQEIFPREDQQQTTN